MCDDAEGQSLEFKLQRRSADICCALEAAEGLLEFSKGGKHRDEAVLYLIRHAHTQASALDHQLNARLEEIDAGAGSGA